MIKRIRSLGNGKYQEKYSAIIRDFILKITCLFFPSQLHAKAGWTFHQTASALLEFQRVAASQLTFPVSVFAEAGFFIPFLLPDCYRV